MNSNSRKMGETDSRATTPKPMNTSIIPSPVASRMARPRAPILHLPGGIFWGHFYRLFEKSNKLHLWPPTPIWVQLAGTSTVSPEKDNQLSPDRTPQTTYPVGG